MNIIEVCKALYNRKYVVGSGGNISIREGDRIYITPTGSILGFLDWNDLAIVKLNGEVVRGKPSSELNLHLKIYQKREDVKAIIHTHSLLSTYIGSRREIEMKTFEGKHFIKKISYVDFLEPGSLELAEEVSKQDGDVIILKDHGIVALGKSLEEAYIKVEVLEEQAKLNLLDLLLNSL
ncbi:L-fuculose phosphate aldolase [Methanocaldococcus infernus]|uniref:L-fuculose phosphate aldolase n=1 Tax=Methanocaldococcus infernus (strain DSM 11812 / JCM 15783 / ME) TaxID=573063 RepID=D5VR88_METIM|nr:L-fuculose phosphate aldolase [Methanocaldococcus infernus]ADG13091.1 L-fuculose-phosphate aldolase [Methanocaldococcus infernus ME]